MSIYIESTGLQDQVLIQTDKLLDFKAYNIFMEAASIAERNASTSAIVIDLYGTEHITDSGKAMLLILYQTAGRLQKKIILINPKPKVKLQLSLDNYLDDLVIEHSLSSIYKSREIVSDLTQEQNTLHAVS